MNVTRSLNNGNLILLNNDDDFTWKQNEHIDFKYEVLDSGSIQQFRTIQISSSQMKQLSNEFLASVSDDNSVFSWSLTSSGFYLDNSSTPSADNYVFSCDENGLKIKGSVTTTGSYGGIIIDGNKSVIASTNWFEDGSLKDSLETGEAGVKIDLRSATFDFDYGNSYIRFS